jgi:hypothetical protein
MVSKSVPRIAAPRGFAFWRPHSRDIQIIMMSGAIGSLEQEMLEKIGIRVFVNKPVPLRTLLRAIVQLMQQRS